MSFVTRNTFQTKAKRSKANASLFPREAHPHQKNSLFLLQSDIIIGYFDRVPNTCVRFFRGQNSTFPPYLPLRLKTLAIRRRRKERLLADTVRRRTLTWSRKRKM